METPLQRIKQYIDFKNLTVSSFEKSLGMSNGSFGSQLKQNKTIGIDKLENILKKYPELSINWVMFGEGSMIRSSKADNNTIGLREYSNVDDLGELKNVDDAIIEFASNNQFIDIGNGKMQMLVPFVENYAYAGYLSGYADAEYVEELPKFPIIVEKQHKGTYRAFKVRGDSMDDDSKRAICSGDIAIGRKVDKNYWTSKLHINQWQNFAIVHQEGIIIKQIIDHDVENGIITCMSLNPDKEFYPTRKLYLKDTYELFNIIQVCRTI